jgi:glycosyltransferase involved in cell wall biosynthesis
MFKSLAKAGYQTWIICTSEPGEEKLDNPNVFYIDLKKWKRAIFKIIQFYLKSFPRIFKVEPDIVVASDLFSLPLAWLVSIKTKAKLIYDSREFYSGLASVSRRKFAQSLLSKFEIFFVSRVSLILTVNQRIFRLLSSKFKYKKIVVIRNYPEQKSSEHSYKIDVKPSDVFLVYLGNFHPGRGFSVYFDLIAKLKSESIDAKLLLIGKGELKNEIEVEIKKREVEDKVFILGPYSPNETFIFPRVSRIIGLCVIEPVSLSYIYSLPNKIFEYISHKIPFVASNFPEIKLIVDKYKVGFLVDPRNFDEIYRAVKMLIEDDSLYALMVKNCEKAIEKLSWENEMKKFYEALESI